MGLKPFEEGNKDRGPGIEGFGGENRDDEGQIEAGNVGVKRPKWVFFGGEDRSYGLKELGI